jgi:hypothetical protein
MLLVCGGSAWERSGLLLCLHRVKIFCNFDLRQIFDLDCCGRFQVVVCVFCTWLPPKFEILKMNYLIYSLG